MEKMIILFVDIFSIPKFQVQTNRRFSTPSLEPLEDMVICPIDLNPLEDPRLLPCGHAFCCTCLTHYMHQLPMEMERTGKSLCSAENTFACPICRTVCPIPPTRSASSFPKAFNHIVILEFLRKNQLAAFKMPGGIQSTDIETNRPPYRKTSIQVNSQMLNYIVSDIAAREQDGKISDTDRAVILDDVFKLLQRLQTRDQLATNNRLQQQQAQQTKASKHQSDCIPVTHNPGSSTPSTASPTGSHRNLGRFQSFAARIRNSRRPSKVNEIQPDFPSYNTYRDVESVRLNMKGNSAYRVLSKGKHCCIMRLGETFQPVDMQMLTLPTSTQLVRYTVTADENQTNLVMWRQQIRPESNLFSSAFTGWKKSPSIISQWCGTVKVDGCQSLKIQYLRFYRKKIYLTGIVASNDPENQWSVNLDESTRNTDLGNSRVSEYGLLVCCNAEEEPESPVQSKPNGKSTREHFSVLATSCIFRRDAVGCERLDQPILFGFDIDKSTGNIYIAQPANAMICRLKLNDLHRIDETWYLNEPPFSPRFLCYAETSKQIWATCPRENKIVILDLETDGFHHFTPTLSFGVSPAHIIYTSDSRIVMLDQVQSRLFWITKVHQTICIQCLDVQFHSRAKRQLMVIQAVDETIESVISKKFGSKQTLFGGILCAHDYGCCIIYPKKKLMKMNPINVRCFSSVSS
ncbi:uncharacterized protein DEA37_0013308 [Paragonimus westermani]|uniref:RING-type domain-containing protein n=1 Tax=Paragonimus westermani TaxID=34504 RepID=A0A5J4N9C9_9TREM|nr:uncharacterized protein DEA37_0013308 [Paragonimus westermani]